MNTRTFRMPRRSAGAIVWSWIRLVVIVPTADWLLFRALGHTAERDLVDVIVFSIFALMTASVVALVAVLALFSFADAIADRVLPRKT